MTKPNEIAFNIWHECLNVFNKRQGSNIMVNGENSIRWPPMKLAFIPVVFDIPVGRYWHEWTGKND